MPATWPVGVPYRVLRKSGSVTPGEIAIRSNTDSGLQRQRAAMTASLDIISGPIRMTYAQYETFEAFRKGLGGATFNWAGHPSGGTVEARFVAGAQGQPAPDPETSKWLVPVAIEVMP